MNLCSKNNKDLGSGVIVEDFVYSGTLSILNPYQPTYHVIQSDNHGMRPDSLREVLSRWTPGGEDDDCPKVLYINPTGANPTGIKQSKSTIYLHYLIFKIIDKP